MLAIVPWSSSLLVVFSEYGFALEVLWRQLDFQNDYAVAAFVQFLVYVDFHLKHHICGFFFYNYYSAMDAFLKRKYHYTVFWEFLGETILLLSKITSLKAKIFQEKGGGFGWMTCYSAGSSWENTSLDETSTKFDTHILLDSLF